MNTIPRKTRRSGHVLVLCAIMMVVMFAVLAFSVDLGYLQVARSQLQTSADAAALAAAWELVDVNAIAGQTDPMLRVYDAHNLADQYAGLNMVAGASPALAWDDVKIGYLSNPLDPYAQIDNTVDPSLFNAVRVLARRTSDQNGEISTFFARVIGTTQSAAQAQATAAFISNIRGFQTPSSGGPLGILPFAFDIESWEELINGVGDDDYTATWDPDAGDNGEWVVTSGGDGILETNLYPLRTTHSAGNRGTVDIGNPTNGVPDVRRQIRYGISEEDLAWHGGTLEFDENGELLLNGDTGLSAGFKDALNEIIGQPRVIPLFNDLSGNGNNAYYTIIGFAGVRLLDVKLTGSMNSKHVTIQPAPMLINGAIPGDSSQKSYYVYSPVWLVR